MEVFMNLKEHKTKYFERIRLEKRINNFGYIYKVNGLFDKSFLTLKKLKRIGSLISSRDLAAAILNSGINSSLFLEGSYVNETGIYNPNRETILDRNSPILNSDSARDATSYHKERKEFPVVSSNYLIKINEERNKRPEEKSILVIPHRNNFEIPSNRFNEDEITLWLFRDIASEYGNFLSDNGVSGFSLELINSKYVDDNRNSFVRHLHLSYDKKERKQTLVGKDFYFNSCNNLRGFKRSI